MPLERRRTAAARRPMAKKQRSRSARRLMLRTPRGEFPIAIAGDREKWERQFRKAAIRWTYIIRNRERWNDLPSSTQEQGRRARRDLIELGVSEAALDSIAREGV